MNREVTTLMMVACCLASHSALHLKVIEKTGDESAHDLSNVQSIDFRNLDRFDIIGKNGDVLESKSYDRTRSLKFDDMATKIKTTKNETEIQVFPNPTQDALMIKGLKEGEKVAIYNSKGQMTYVSTVDAKEKLVDVSRMGKGTYVLKAGSKTVKFIKE